MKPLTPEEAAAEGLPDVLTPEQAAAEGLPGGTGGGGGSEGGALGGAEGVPKPLEQPKKKFGSLLNFLQTMGNEALLGAGPQIEGGMAAVAQDAKNLFAGEPFNPKVTPLEAYKTQRDISKDEYAEAADTVTGNAGKLPGMMLTPVPVKALPRGAGILAKAKQGAKVGAGVGALSGAVSSDVDLTKDNPLEDYAKLLLDTGAGAGGGAVGGGVLGGAFGLAEKPLRSTARRLPMDMLGVSEPARRSMQKQGIYDKAGDALLELVRPLRSGMRKGSLTEDALAELGKRGENVGATEAAIDAAAPSGAVTTGSQVDAIARRAEPFKGGSLQDKQVARRMEGEAKNLLDTLGSTDPEIGARIPLAEAEAFKQRFGPAVGKQLRHAGEPAAKTDALAEVYRALKEANEAGAKEVSPQLADDFVKAKKDYQTLAAPLEGANVERSGMRSSDFDWGDALSQPETPLIEKLAAAGVPKWMAGAVLTPMNLAGRAYGRGATANLAEFLANRAANNTGGNFGGRGGARGGQSAVDALEPWARFLLKDEEKP